MEQVGLFLGSKMKISFQHAPGLEQLLPTSMAQLWPLAVVCLETVFWSFVLL